MKWITINGSSSSAPPISQASFSTLRRYARRARVSVNHVPLSLQEAPDMQIGEIGDHSIRRVTWA